MTLYSNLHKQQPILSHFGTDSDVTRVSFTITVSTYSLPFRLCIKLQLQNCLSNTKVRQNQLHLFCFRKSNKSIKNLSEQNSQRKKLPKIKWTLHINLIIFTATKLTVIDQVYRVIDCPDFSGLLQNQRDWSQPALGRLNRSNWLDCLKASQKKTCEWRIGRYPTINFMGR
jgi:hypothetical protein